MRRTFGLLVISRSSHVHSLAVTGGLHASVCFEQFIEMPKAFIADLFANIINFQIGVGKQLGGIFHLATADKSNQRLAGLRFEGAAEMRRA